VFDRFTGLWRRPDFLKLWAGETVSQFGSLIGGMALGFAAILVLGASPLQIALLAIASRLPSFLTGLFAGVWVDRLRRRPIMIAADCGRALLLATIPLAALLGVLRIEQLYLVAFLTGILTTFFDVAYQSYLPTLVDREALVEGNSKLATTASIAEISGFGIAGWLVQLISAPFAILVDAVSFLGSALALGLIRTPEPRPVAGSETSNIFREAREGLRVVARNPRLRSLAITTIILEFSFQIVGAVISLFGLKELGFSPGVLGTIYGVGGISALSGSLLAAPAARRFGTGRVMVGGILMMGLSILLVPLAPGATAVGASILVAQQLFGDGCYMVYDITQVSVRQAITPDRLLGRVNATVRVGALGAMLVGALVGGLLGNTYGLRAALVVGAGGTILGALWLGLSPVWSLRDKPEMITEPSAG
jgi:MFS family permease